MNSFSISIQYYPEFDLFNIRVENGKSRNSYWEACAYADHMMAKCTKVKCPEPYKLFKFLGRSYWTPDVPKSFEEYDKDFVYVPKKIWVYPEFHDDGHWYRWSASPKCGWVFNNLDEFSAVIHAIYGHHERWATPYHNKWYDLRAIGKSLGFEVGFQYKLPVYASEYVELKNSIECEEW